MNCYLFPHPDKSSDEELMCNDMIDPHPPNLSMAQPKYTSLIPTKRKNTLSRKF